MSENQFTVDLGEMRLTDQQRTSINMAIQKAVAGELANVSNVGHVVMVPIFKGKGTLINGLVARLVNDKLMNEIINVKTL